MNLGSQYYRAPFPNSKYWEDDLKKMRDSGLNTVQIWISWGWVEAAPDKFEFSDYDRLAEISQRVGIGVVFSTIAEIHPNWIHRVVPDSELIDCEGHKVISVGRNEHHFGLTPGGCFDHPEIWARMKRFIQTVGRRYSGLDNLRGWDIWNELRWNINARRQVCYCPHTLALFRRWLQDRYGSLDRLNDAWLRRYCDWADVAPGRAPDQSSYTETMAFQEFITWRSNRHAAMRCQAMREIDPVHVITAHGDAPSPFSGGTPRESFALERGNDWELAKNLDGIGCSSFPQWGGIDDADFGIRIDMVKSAANGKKVWLSELQGGRASIGFSIYGDVRAEQQQRWLWNGLGSGADTILFWCWRDEVFGRESAGFGLNGRDGFAEERLRAMKVSGGIIAENEALFERYMPNHAEVGILFSPRSYYMGWAQDGQNMRMGDALSGYARALTKRSIPMVFMEADNLDRLDDLKVLIMPHVTVVDDDLAERLTGFVEKGGTLVMESECGAFDRHGFYRYPEERFMTRFGLTETGRRAADREYADFVYRGQTFRLCPDQWTTPIEGEENLCVERRYGLGRVIYFGTYPAYSYRQKYSAAWEELLLRIVDDSGVILPARVLSPMPGEKDFLYMKCGHSDGTTLLFVFFPPEWEEAELKIAPGLFSGGKAVELFSGETIDIPADRQITVHPGFCQIAVYRG